MDANELLVKVRRASDEVLRAHDAEDVTGMAKAAVGLVSAFMMLDGFLSGGGFPPEIWREGPDGEPADDGLRMREGDRGKWYVFDGDTPIAGPFSLPPS